MIWSDQQLGTLEYVCCGRKHWVRCSRSTAIAGGPRNIFHRNNGHVWTSVFRSPVAASLVTILRGLSWIKTEVQSLLDISWSRDLQDVKWAWWVLSSTYAVPIYCICFEGILHLEFCIAIPFTPTVCERGSVSDAGCIIMWSGVHQAPATFE